MRDFSLTEVCNKYLKDINLSSRKISVIDPEFVKYCSYAEILSLSFNKLLSIESLPQNIYGFNAYSNLISSVTPLSKFNNLVHVGLGYNRLNDLKFLQECPYLSSVDVSFNDLISLEQSLEALKNVEKLKSLNLQGNCFCMLDYYRGAVYSNLPSLTHFDNEELMQEDRQRYIDIFKGYEQEKSKCLIER